LLGLNVQKSAAQGNKEKQLQNYSPHLIDSEQSSPLKPATRPIPEKLRKKIAKDLKKVNFDEILKRGKKAGLNEGQGSMQNLP